jgi:hypothetical protein
MHQWIPAFEGVEKYQFAVIPAKAGIPKHLKPMDSCLRRNDGKVEMLRFSTPSFAGMTGQHIDYDLRIGRSRRIAVMPTALPVERQYRCPLGEPNEINLLISNRYNFIGVGTYVAVLRVADPMRSRSKVLRPAGVTLK